MSLVTIIVPIYNEEKHLRKCIESLRAQTLKDIQIILVNDESTDSSGDICDEYAQKDNRIQVIHQFNTGQGIARNIGIKQAKSPYIGFVDADDWVEKDMFEKMYQTAIQTQADITMCNCFEVVRGMETTTHIKTTTNILEHEQIIKELLLPMVGGTTLQDHYENNIPGYVCRCLYKQELIQGLTFISEREILFEDLWFNIQAMYRSNKIAIVPEPLYHYIHHEVSFVTTYKKDLWERQQRLDTLILNFFKAHHIKEPVEHRMNTRKLIHLFSSMNNEVYVENKKTTKQQKQAIIDMCMDEKIQEALRQVEPGQITLKQKIRLMLIKKRWFNILYWVVKGEYRFKKRS